MKDAKTQIEFAQGQLAIAAKLQTSELIAARIKTAIAALNTALVALK